jgi:uncharacterized protein YegL
MGEMFEDIIVEEDEKEVVEQERSMDETEGKDWPDPRPLPFLTNHVTFILDCSGSMERISEQSKSNFNEQLQTLKKESHDQETLVTLVMFSDQINTLYMDRPIDDVDELVNYPTNGMTALHDAIGMTANRLRILVKEDHSALVIVITDGEENASSDYGGEDGRKKIKSMIEELEGKGNWTFTFLGANIDVERVGTKGMSIGALNTMNFTADAQGVKRMSANMGGGITAYYNARRGGETQVKDFFNKSDEKTEDTTNTDNVVVFGVTGEVNDGSQTQGQTPKK